MRPWTPERGNELKYCVGWADWAKSPLTLAKEPRPIWSLTKRTTVCVGSEQKEAKTDIGGSGPENPDAAL